MSVSRYIPKPQFFTSAGALANGYKAFYYAAGTQTKVDTFTTVAGSVANANPIVLNARGENLAGGIYLTDGVAYDVWYCLPTDTDPPTSPIWTDPSTFGHSSEDLASTSDVAKGDALIGVKRVGTGAVGTTLHTWIERGEVYVEDFGDTSTAAGTLSAFNAALATGKRVLAFTAAYTLSGPIVLTTGMRLRGAGLNKTKLTFQNTDGFSFTSASVNDGYLDLEGFTVSTTATTANNTTKGMDLTGVNYSRFEDIAVEYHQKGWYLSRGAAGKGCYFNKIVDTFAYYNQIGYEINNVVTDNSVNGNIFINPHVEGNYAWPGQIAYSVSGYGHKFISPYGGGLNATPKAVTSVTVAGTTATCTCPAHGYLSNDTIINYGANEAGHNGAHLINVTNANVYTYTVASGTANPATGTLYAASEAEASIFMRLSQGSPSGPYQSVCGNLLVQGAYCESSPLIGFLIPITTSARYGNLILGTHFDGACVVDNFHDPLGELTVIGAGGNQLTQTTTIFNGDLQVNSATYGFQNREGVNATQGISAAMVAGTTTISTAAVAANSRIFLTVQALGTVAVPKAIAVTSRVAGTSFTITSADATDTSTVAWEIFDPIP